MGDFALLKTARGIRAAASIPLAETALPTDAPGPLAVRRSMTSLVGAILLQLTSVALAADWSQYRGAHGDGKSLETAGPLTWPAEGPRQLWKIDTPLGFSSFAVAGGRTFTLIVREDEDGQKNESCLALDAETGRELWCVRLGPAEYGHDGGNSGAPGNRGGDGPRSTPASDGQRVFVYDAHLVLSCVDAKTGDVVWRNDIAQQYAGPNIKWKNASSPLIDSSHVYIPGGGPGQSFLAFDKVTGELFWKSGDETMTHATPRLVTIHGQRQVIFFARSGLVSVDASRGQECWRTMVPFNISTAASPVVHRDLVYCSAAYGVGAVLFKIGANGSGYDVERVWSKTNKLMNHWSTPVCLDGHLYGLYGHKKFGKAPLQCVEMTTGEVKWAQPGFGAGNCILVGDQLLVLSDDGQLAVVKASPDAYTELARAQVLEGKCWSTPAYCNGRVYVRSTKEGACFDLRGANQRSAGAT